MKDQTLIDLYKFEEELYDIGAHNICGVDEAGRGPLAGPVVVAACILPPFLRIEGINDSKQLSKKKKMDFIAVFVQSLNMIVQKLPKSLVVVGIKMPQAANLKQL